MLDSQRVFLAGLVLLPFCLAMFFTAIMIRLAPRMGLMDLPAARKVHSQPIPKGGGLAYVSAIAATLVMLPWLVRGDGPLRLDWMRWGLASVIFSLGLADDIRPIHWSFRLTIQGVVAAAAVWFLLPDMPGWGRALGVFWLVAMVNAFNMLDNMDALSGGVGTIAAIAMSCGLLLYPGFENDQDYQELSRLLWPNLILAGAVAGFLIFNAPPARIFMGDAGSTFLGYMIGTSGLQLATLAGAPPWWWLGVLCICAIPIYDQLTVVLIRLGQGHSPFHADKQHLSHRLASRGMSSRNAVRTIHLLTLASGGAGLAVFSMGSWMNALIVLGFVLAGFACLGLVELVPFAIKSVRKK